MELIEYIQPGMTREENFLVEDENSAYHIGSGDTRVLATPWMIAFMERVSHRLLMEHLPRGYTTVGIRVDVQHLAPTPVGFFVRVQAQVREIIKNRVTFSVIAWDACNKDGRPIDGAEKIGTGTHQRAALEEHRFLKRVTEKIRVQGSVISNQNLVNSRLLDH